MAPQKSKSGKKKSSIATKKVPMVVKDYVKRTLDRAIEDKYTYTAWLENIYSRQESDNPTSYISTNIFTAWPMPNGPQNSFRIGDRVKFKYLSFNGELRNNYTNAVTVKVSWVCWASEVQPVFNVGITSILGSSMSDMFAPTEPYCDQWSITNGGVPIPKFTVLKTKEFHLAGTLGTVAQEGSSRRIKVSCKPKVMTHYVNDKDEPVRNYCMLIFNISNDVGVGSAVTQGVNSIGWIHGIYQDA